MKAVLKKDAILYKVISISEVQKCSEGYLMKLYLRRVISVV